MLFGEGDSSLLANVYSYLHAYFDKKDVPDVTARVDTITNVVSEFRHCISPPIPGSSFNDLAQTVPLSLDGDEY